MAETRTWISAIFFISLKFVSPIAFRSFFVINNYLVPVFPQLLSFISNFV